MADNPVVSIIITTHNRTRIACETIDSLCKNLKYAGELKWIISDDRSEPGHVQTLVEQFEKFDIIPICKYTNQNNYSLGASLNNGLLEGFRYGDVCMTTEDDWILQKELDITEHVQFLLKNESIAAIRLASILKSCTKKYDDRYLLVYGDPGSKKNAVFNNQVALRHRRVYQTLGYYYPNISPDHCEGSYRDKFNDYTSFGTENLQVLFPNEIELHTLDSPNMYFIHCGVSTVGHTKYQVPERYEHFYSERMVNICMVIDNNYVDQTLAMIQNLKEVMTCDKAIYILAWDISGENRVQIESMSNNTCRVFVKTVLPYYIKQCLDAGGYERDGKRYTVPPTGLLKFCIGDILKNCEKVLYIDGDMEVRSSLEELFDIDVSEYYCAAVPDIGSITMMGKPLCKIMQGNPKYFNSGMMLLNLVKMREDRMMGKLFKIKKGLEDRSLMDQDALNIGFAGHVKLLPCRFNYLHGITTSVKNKVLTVEQINKLYGTDYTSVDAAKSDIVIYHYAGWTKPWRPMQETWKKRLEKSRILDERNDRKFVSVIQSKKEDISKVKSDTSLQKKPQTIKQEVVTKNGHDAVFVLGDGSLYQDKELAFAVHSMRKFCPFIDRIFIVGAKPRCSLKGMNCIHILCRDVMSTNKDANMMFKVFHAIKTIPDLTDDFLLCSDDQLVTKPCTWEDFKPKYVCKFCKDSQMFLKLRSSSTWGYKLYNTLLKVQQSGRKAYFYEPHIWSPVNKEAFKDMFIAIGGSINAGVIKSQYYNSILGLDHEKLHDHAFFDSPSLDWSDAFKNPPKFISYNDKAFDSEAFRQQLMMLLK